MNKVFLMGNLARDPELKQTQSGKSYVRTAIAVNRPFSKNKEVDFFNLLAWNQTAEFLSKYFPKGSKALIEGRLQTNSYEKDGNKINAIEVVVDQVEFAGAKKENSNRNDFSDAPPEDVDMPF